MELQAIQAKQIGIKKQLSEQERISFYYSCFRFLLILITIFSIYQGYEANNALYYILGFIVFIGFLYCIRKHMMLQSKIEYLHALWDSYQDITARKQQEWKSFLDDGSEFLKEDTTQAFDLDIFGKASLYQYVSCVKTPEGKIKLASLFSPIAPSVEIVKERQAAVHECIEKEDFTLKFTSLSKLFAKHTKKKRKQNTQNLYAFMEREEVAYPSIIRYLACILSIMTLLFTIAIPLFQITYAGALICFVGSLCIGLLFSMKNGAVLSPLSQIASQMKSYEVMLSAIQAEKFQSGKLLELQRQVKDATSAIRSLNTILQFVQARNNIITNFILNGFFMLDFQCIFALERWISRYGKQVEPWLCAIGEVESYVSLAQVGFAKKSYTFPEILSNEEPSFHSENMHHPLLHEEQAIANDFEGTASSYIVTGSNMSGKTTFLRTIGINMILCNAGAPVCATEWKTSLVSIYTSMRVMDDVGEGISTFYAEILRIRDMMEASKQELPMLVLIDEIFKGTNSADRIVCAKEAITKLHHPWVITFVSTHDFELCDLEKDTFIKAVNYHFSEYYEDDKICFDYLLKDGRCKTTNARQLMKLAGF